LEEGHGNDDEIDDRDRHENFYGDGNYLNCDNDNILELRFRCRLFQEDVVCTKGTMVLRETAGRLRQQSLCCRLAVSENRVVREQDAEVLPRVEAGGPVAALHEEPLLFDKRCWVLLHGSGHNDVYDHDDHRREHHDDHIHGGSV
jgi:hypothetical protein